MVIKVIIADAFQLSTGGVPLVDVDGDTIGDCMQKVVKQYPDLKKVWFAADGTISKYVLLALNGKIVPGNPVDQTVETGDELFPMLRMVGG